jgi:hypothetical protein
MGEETSMPKAKVMRWASARRRASHSRDTSATSHQAWRKVAHSRQSRSGSEEPPTAHPPRGGTAIGPGSAVSRWWRPGWLARAHGGQAQARPPPLPWWQCRSRLGGPIRLLCWGVAYADDAWREGNRTLASLEAQYPARPAMQRAA